MPLHNGVQLIVQVQQPSGNFSCEARTDLPLVNPVFVAFCHAGTSAAASAMNQLVGAFWGELDTVAGGTVVSPPCGGGAVVGCHALIEADCQKLLVLIGDAQAPVSASSLPLLGLWGKDPSFSILPVYPDASKAMLSNLLPSDIQQQNAAFWANDVEEALPAVFAASGITTEQPKIFISYRQTDSAELAIQLFDELARAGFDVFLDHFRIPPGVNFQARLTQELGDKSMVLVIESARLQASAWVLYEINVAKACGLGLCAVNLDLASKVPGIDDEVRHMLVASDFSAGRVGGRLTAAALASVVTHVRAEHDRAILRRRIALEKSFEEAVRRASGRLPVREANGAYRVSHSTKDYLAWITTRPPDMPDFHHLHGAAQKPTVGVMIGLSRLMEPPRALRNSWLAGLCDLKVVDEGRLVWAAGEMAGGRL